MDGIIHGKVTNFHIIHILFLLLMAKNTNTKTPEKRNEPSTLVTKNLPRPKKKKRKIPVCLQTETMRNNVISNELLNRHPTNILFFVEFYFSSTFEFNTKYSVVGSSFLCIVEYKN